MKSLLSFVLKTSFVNCEDDETAEKMAASDCKEELKATIAKEGGEVTIASKADPENKRFAVTKIAICTEGKSSMFGSATHVCSNVLNLSNFELVTDKKTPFLKALSDADQVFFAFQALKTANDLVLTGDDLAPVNLHYGFEPNKEFLKDFKLPDNGANVKWQAIADWLKPDAQKEKASLLGIKPGDKSFDASSVSFRKAFMLYLILLPSVKVAGVEALKDVFTFKEDSLKLEAGRKVYFALELKFFDSEKMAKSPVEYSDPEKGVEIVRTNWLQISSDGKKFEETAAPKKFTQSWTFRIIVGFSAVGILSLIAFVIMKKIKSSRAKVIKNKIAKSGFSSKTTSKLPKI